MAKVTQAATLECRLKPIRSDASADPSSWVALLLQLNEAVQSDLPSVIGNVTSKAHFKPLPISCVSVTWGIIGKPCRAQKIKRGAGTLRTVPRRRRNNFWGFYPRLTCLRHSRHKETVERKPHSVHSFMHCRN